MARMIPAIGPVQNASEFTEPTVYHYFKHYLADEFTVIHSLPWICRVVAKNYPQTQVAPTGQLDFLILHPQLGLLALEVKGGVVSFDQCVFVLRDGTPIDPVEQVRKGTHGLSKWLYHRARIPVRIGYALLLPHSEIHGRMIPPSLHDPSPPHPFTIVLDKHDLRQIDQRIRDLMWYWKDALTNPNLGTDTMTQILNLVCPVADYTPSWLSRINTDTREWLSLTPEQARCLQQVSTAQRSIVTGRSGTGKTLLAVTRAQQLATEHHQVLFVVFNNALARHLQELLPHIHVQTFHALCIEAARSLRVHLPADLTKGWFHHDGPLVFQRAVDAATLPTYDALLVDEAQVFHQDWLHSLVQWFANKPAMLFCDETQVFPYEQRTTTETMAQIFQAGTPFLLTMNLRSPHTVFERLREVLPAHYDQHTRRPPESDTLEEKVTDDPLLLLYETIARLHDEDVPPAMITVVYTHQQPPYPREIAAWLTERENVTDVLDSEWYNDYKAYLQYRGIEEWVNHTSFIGRFRGLEAPVIIVYATGPLDDTLLACAYARATSRCIAIYAASGFFGRGADTRFSTSLVRDRPAIRSVIDSRWPPPKTWDVTPVVSATASIYWSHQWGGWCAWKEAQQDYLASILWLLHLLTWTKLPIYFVQTIGKGRGIHAVHYQPTEEVIPYTSTWYALAWCDVCARWTRHGRNLTDQWCDDCMCNEGYYALPALAAQLAKDEAILLEPHHYTSDEKRQLSAFLMTLGYWRQLETDDQRNIRSAIEQRSIFQISNPIHYLFWVLTAIDIYRTEEGGMLKRDDLISKYQKWFPTLNLTEAMWHKLGQPNLNAWMRHGWIAKPHKGRSGVYVRLPSPPDEASSGNTDVVSDSFD